MRKLAFALVAGLAALVLQPADSRPDEKLTADEIQKLLDGRTALGNWRGTETRQYFASNGATTIYLPKGGPPDEGKWKVDQAKNQYCSWWRARRLGLLRRGNRRHDLLLGEPRKRLPLPLHHDRRQADGVLAVIASHAVAQPQ